MPSPVEEIKSRLDIADIIRGYVRLEKAGRDFKARCPFHQEKTPSFTVSAAKQLWYCFGCNRGGDVFKFVMEIEGQDFPEALKMLASRAGVELKREDPLIRSERNRLYDINELAAKIFSYALAKAAAPRAYLAERGVTPETITKFRIGFSPAKWDFLVSALASRNVSEADMERAGLAIRSAQHNTLHDRFRSRIIFPIADAGGRIVGFGGRIFGPTTDNTAKYINTPATPVYDKSRTLYGFHLAKEAIRRENSVIVVEGYMDCIMSHQAGVDNTIAVSGTALTPAQLAQLRRLSERLITSFDTDSAGESATKRSLALAAESEFDRRIAAIPSGKDPADTVRENPELWRTAVRDAKSVVDFFFEKAFARYSPERADGKKAIADLLFPYIADLASEIERSHWVSQTAVRLGVPDAAVWKDLVRYRRKDNAPDRAPVNAPPAAPAPERRALLEEHFLSLLAAQSDGQRRKEIPEPRIAFSSALRQTVYDILTSPEAQTIPPHLAETIALLALKGERAATMAENIEDAIHASRTELERLHIREQLKSAGCEIREKEQRGEPIPDDLLKKSRDLSQRMKEAMR